MCIANRDNATEKDGNPIIWRKSSIVEVGYCRQKSTASIARHYKPRLSLQDISPHDRHQDRRFYRLRSHFSRRPIYHCHFYTRVNFSCRCSIIHLRSSWIADSESVVTKVEDEGDFHADARLTLKPQQTFRAIGGLVEVALATPISRLVQINTPEDYVDDGPSLQTLHFLAILKNETSNQHFL
ncbi:uncharacterized protein BT62DRAFT_920024 [Guyanagaster necrorhizus]|uniref:Uncharacterized protein n=1 Tax=Guyanagaster necrorhizus TaxID=856835 RepID=A0A9P7VSL3_9AGAR|nr:uncharacterized protein BT62DRAFT_920024 [Guyanagaster necrorhizus MCA 3950]KAG7445945.1 hypothetical protein BT62DRAFT_920024 [Guyanagaster necrorhizus MCA 3950]